MGGVGVGRALRHLATVAGQQLSHVLYTATGDTQLSQGMMGGGGGVFDNPQVVNEQTPNLHIANLPFANLKNATFKLLTCHFRQIAYAQIANLKILNLIFIK